MCEGGSEGGSESRGRAGVRTRGEQDWDRERGRGVKERVRARSDTVCEAREREGVY